MMTVGVLALQGAFAEHCSQLRQLGAEARELRCRADARSDFDALILPGGESTVQTKLLERTGMLEVLREKIASGLPILATCAGLILLAEKVVGRKQPVFGALPVTVRRNAYGRQLASFQYRGAFADLGELPQTFIRAPKIESCRADVTVLARCDGVATAVRYRRQLAMSFHPELTDSTEIMSYFLRRVASD